MYICILIKIPTTSYVNATLKEMGAWFLRIRGWGECSTLGANGENPNVSKRTQESGRPLPLSYSLTELILHELGWGSYCLEGRMHGQPSVISRTVSPLTTSMPREANGIQFLTWVERSSFHSHAVVCLPHAGESLASGSRVLIFPFTIWPGVWFSFTLGPFSSFYAGWEIDVVFSTNFGCCETFWPR